MSCLAVLPKLGRFLVAGEGTWDEAVNIPDLATRLHELPRSTEAVEVVGPQAEETVKWLCAGGRAARLGASQCLSSKTPLRPQFRLWSPNPFLETSIEGVPPGRAWDIGCGSGRDSVFLASLGWNVVAVDHLLDAVERGRDLEQRYCDDQPIIWRVGDALAVPPQDLDLVIMMRCYAADFLLAAFQAIGPNGMVLIEAFSEAHRIATGHPSNPSYVFHQSDVPLGLKIVSHDVGETWQQVIIHLALMHRELPRVCISTDLNLLAARE